MRPQNCALDPALAPAAEPLREATVAWLRGLPDRVRPHTLARDFPRIANRLCELWRRPSQCDAYFNELIFDDRGGRAGFRPQIMRELGTLAAHYSVVYPTRRSSWLGVRKR